MASTRPASSTGTTASAPGGIGAPVITFQAAPGGSAPGTAPAPEAPATVRRAGVRPDLGRADGPPVHRGRVEEGERSVGADVLGENASDGVVERDLAGRHGQGRLEDEAERLLERDHDGRDRSKTLPAAVSRIHSPSDRRFQYTGDLGQEPLPEILRTIHFYRAPGVLTVESGGVTKKVYLLGGNIIFATSIGPERVARRST